MQEQVLPAELNEYQRKAVFNDSSACLVNANVGSGKTTVLTAKVKYLHEACGVNCEDMVVLTFTNKAAGEIRERLGAMRDQGELVQMRYFGTFHSVALQLLRERLPVQQLGYTPDFLVMDPEEELDMALRLIQDRKLQIKYRNRLKKRLEQEDEEAVPSENGREKLPSPPGRRIQDDMPILLQAMKEEKRARNRMTFADLIRNTEALLAKVEWRPAWVIIDEVQDCDAWQLALVRRLLDKGARLFAVGDPNQVIYSWRGSACNVFYTLRTEYQATELSLPVNYRSSASILEAASAFSQYGSSLTGNRERGSKIVVKKHYDPFQEACYLADRIKELLGSGISPGQIAVFYRLQNQSGVLEEVFAREEIPFQVSVKHTLRDCPVQYWLLQVLRFSLSREDYPAGIYALSHKEYGERRNGKPITEKTAAAVLHGEKDLKLPLYERMLAFSECCPSLDSPQALYDYFSLDGYLHPTSASFQKDKERILAMLESLFRQQPSEGENLPDRLRSFLNDAVLYGLPEQETKEEDGRVKLMTLHASKGLEFSFCFIIGVNYGLIPLRTAGFEEEDEERRLFFVGMTRAKDFLELSYYTNPDNRVMPGESRFIRMIPPELIQEETADPAQGNLQELRKMVRQEIEARQNRAEETLEADLPELPEEPSQPQPAGKEIIQPRTVIHRKYGRGTVIREDDAMMEIEFEGYGAKEFLKAFSAMEFVEE